MEKSANNFYKRACALFCALVLVFTISTEKAHAITTQAAVDQEVTGITDVDSLGLPAIALVITSKFPFSIPWDIMRGIKLIAAPASAPYWQVDFLAPLSQQVGGWKGSTVITLDFGQYPIIGQLSRWSSTIGFCLMLAMGTKKLLWTT